METQKSKYKYLKVVLKYSLNDFIYRMLSCIFISHSLMALILAYPASFFHF